MVHFPFFQEKMFAKGVRNGDPMATPSNCLSYSLSIQKWKFVVHLRTNYFLADTGIKVSLRLSISSMHMKQFPCGTV